jgi:serine protease Do
MKKYSLAMALVALGGLAAGEARAQQMLQELQSMVQGGSYLGIAVQELSTERAQALKLKEERGVEVTIVEQASPAEQAGLKVGDVVLEFAGEKVQGIYQFARMVRETPAGRKVKLGLWRNGTTANLMATVGTRKSVLSQRIPKSELPQGWISDVPRPTIIFRSAGLGVEAEELDGQLAQYFGVANGVLLRSIIEGSPAEKAGLRAGDVITKVAGTDVATPRDISRQLKEFEGRSAQVTTIRDHKELNINVTLAPDASRGGGRTGGRMDLIAE